MKNLIIWAVVLGSLGYGGSKLLLHHKVGQGVDQAVMLMSPLVNIEYEGVSSTMSGELSIDGIKATLPGFTEAVYIDRLGIDTPSYFSLLDLADISENIQSPDDVIPKSFGFMIEGARMRVNSDYFRKAYAASVKGISAESRQEDAARCTGKYGFSMGEAYGIEFDEYVIDPYTEFLDGKSTLVVTARPSEPISLSQISLYKPSDVPALLELSAEAL